MAKAKKVDAGTESGDVVESGPAMLSYGDDIKVPVSQIPTKAMITLMQRTFSHIMGNEAASAWKGAVERAKKDDATATDQEVFRQGKDDFLAKWRQAKVETILADKLGEAGGPRGPRKVGLEAHIADAALAHIKARAAAKGKAVPKGDALKAALAFAVTIDKVIAEGQRRFDEANAAANESDDDMDEYLS